jgi:hypothetical protein
MRLISWTLQSGSELQMLLKFQGSKGLNLRCFLLTFATILNRVKCI